VTAWIELEGLDNLRDLGGLRTSAGAEIASYRLWRSDNLQTLSAADATRLRDLGLTDVVDLRSGFEVRTEGPTLLTDQDWVTYHWYSLVPEMDGELPKAAVPLPEDASTLLTDPIAASYLGYITERPRAITDAMRVVGNAPGAALVHCAAGKDRTGTVIALTLGALDVPRADIVADYALTTERIGPVVERMRRAHAYTGRMDDVPLEMFHARPEVMESLLGVIDSVWGGVVPLLTTMGWTDDDQEALENRLLL
jgi:hypothetical protein